MILLDTNVISEGMRPRPSDAVRVWLNAQRANDLFLCAPVLAELHYGVERLPPGGRREHLEAVLKAIEDGFSDRTLAFEAHAASEFGRVMADREKLGLTMGTIDGMIASIARIHEAAIATRDVRGFEHLRVDLVDPFVV